MVTSADTLDMLAAYKRWANRLVYEAVAEIGPDERERSRATTFGNILMTLNHSFVVDDIFRHHLTGTAHGYAQRNTEQAPRFEDLRAAASDMDQWYCDQVAGWSPDERREIIPFSFVDGGSGRMTREQIVLHVVNHATYHRGFVGDMLRQIPFAWPANDLTVFLRDVWSA